MSNKITEFFDKIIAKIKSFWETDVQPTLDQMFADIEPELQTLAVTDIQVMANDAYAAIKAAAAAGKTPEDWLDPAYDAIKAALPALGKSLSSTAINLLATLFQGHAKAAAVADGTTVQAIVTAPETAA